MQNYLVLKGKSLESGKPGEFQISRKETMAATIVALEVLAGLAFSYAFGMAIYNNHEKKTDSSSNVGDNKTDNAYNLAVIQNIIDRCNGLNVCELNGGNLNGMDKSTNPNSDDQLNNPLDPKTKLNNLNMKEMRNNGESVSRTINAKIKARALYAKRRMSPMIRMAKIRC